MKPKDISFDSSLDIAMRIIISGSREERTLLEQRLAEKTRENEELRARCKLIMYMYSIMYLICKTVFSV